MTDEKLIYFMEKGNWSPESDFHDMARVMLSVIRSHYDLVEKGKVHEYAALCQGCGGVGSILKISSDAEEEDAIVCPDCHGHGVVKIEKKG